MKNRVITISREFGSGGRTIGKRVAAELALPCYDNELLQKIAAESGFQESYIKETGEDAPGGFLSNAFSHRGFSPNNADYLWQIQYRIISELAEKGPCVIVGRCADYALADEPHCLNIFIRSNMDDRIKRISERLNVTENKAKDIIKKKDKERSSYYNYYTSKKWGDARSYDLCLNTSQISVEDSIELILKYRECMRSHNK